MTFLWRFLSLWGSLWGPENTATLNALSRGWESPQGICAWMYTALYMSNGTEHWVWDARHYNIKLFIIQIMCSNEQEDTEMSWLWHQHWAATLNTLGLYSKEATAKCLFFLLKIDYRSPPQPINPPSRGRSQVRVYCKTLTLKVVGGLMSCLSRQEDVCWHVGLSQQNILCAHHINLLLYELSSSCVVGKGKHSRRPYLMELGPLALSAQLPDTDTPQQLVCRTWVSLSV